MAILDPIYAHVLAARVIPNIEYGLAQELKLHPEQRSLGLITADNDDALYVSIDHATKMADVEVVYAHSFYAGAKHSSGLLSGEIIAMLAGPNPAEVIAGMDAAIDYLQNKAIWYSANQDGSIAFFAHLISQTGSYLSETSGLPLKTPLAYLIAPPLEGVLALDAALKAADVSIAAYTAPPSETNYRGVMLTGDQSACKAAAAAFQEMVLDVAANPIQY
ncbi:MAG: ethanolamine utilization microcompartment protein EutL [Anaerolineaceae bacterium]|nr:ethanolamine utilization microcompartment protein EutL [Anaerolineaceae bacterium]